MTDPTLKYLESFQPTAPQGAPQPVDPRQQYASALEATKKAWHNTQTDNAYLFGSDAERKVITDQFDADNPLGKHAHIDEDNVNNSILVNIGKQFGQGALQVFSGARSLDDILGETDKDTGARLFREAQEVHYTPYEKKQFQASLVAVDKKVAAENTWYKKAAVWGKAVASEAYNNPVGSMYMAASSLVNTVPGLLAGGITGAVTRSPKAVMAAQTAASTLTEAGIYFNNAIMQEVVNRGLPNSQESYDSIVADTEFIDKIKLKSLRKGLGTAITDTAMGVGMAKLATRPLAEGAGLVTKTGRKARSLALETASEPISEAVGTATAGDEQSASELMAETIGGAFGSPLMQPLNVALYGTKAVAQDPIQSAKAAKEILLGSAGIAAGTAQLAGKGVVGAAKAVKSVVTKKTPEQVVEKEKIKEMKQEAKVLRKQAQAPASFKNKEKITELAETGKVDPLLDIESETADPITGVAALNEMNSKKDLPLVDQHVNHEKSMEVINALKEKKMALIEQIEALTDDTPTKHKQDQIDVLNQQAASVQQTLVDIVPMVKSMNPAYGVVEQADHMKSMENIRKTLKSNDAQEVQKISTSFFGSRKGSDISIEDVLQEPGITDLTKEELKAVAAIDAKEDEHTGLVEDRLAKSDKTSAQVSQDIFKGGEGFKGINDYKRAIALGLQENKPEFVQKQLSALKAFTERHSDKADLFVRALEAGNLKKLTDKKDLALLADLNRARRKDNPLLKGYDIHPGSRDFVKEIVAEADALHLTVHAAELFIANATAKDSKIISTEQKILNRSMEDFGTPGAARIVETQELSPEHKSLQKLSKIFKAPLHFYEAVPGKKINLSGYSPTDSSSVFLDRNMSSPIHAVLGHEIFHQMARKYPDLLKELAAGAIYKKGAIADYGDSHAPKGSTKKQLDYFNSKREEELLASFTGDQFSKQEFWDKLHDKNIPLFKKLLTIVKEVLSTALKGTLKADSYFADIEATQEVLVAVTKKYLIRENALDSSQGTAEKVATKAEPINIWYGSKENRYLSNLTERPFRDSTGKKFLSVEHAYQSLKSGKYDPVVNALYVKNGAGKKIVGRKGTKTRDNWNIALMRTLMLQSFKQNPGAIKQLLSTGDNLLTHNQDRGIWKTVFPQLLTEIREQLSTKKPIKEIDLDSSQDATKDATDPKGKKPTEKSTETDPGTSAPTDDKGKPADEKSDVEDGKERSPIEEGDVTPIKNSITVADKNDPENKIKGKFRAKATKAINLIQETNDMVKFLVKGGVDKIVDFTKNNPFDDQAEKLAASMKDFGENFQKSFAAEFKRKEVVGTSKDNLKAIFKTFNFVGFTGSNKAGLINKILGAMPSPNMVDTMSTEQIITALDNAKNKEIQTLWKEGKVFITKTKQTLLFSDHLKSKLASRDETAARKGKDYRIQDPLQFLLDADGNMPVNVINSMMAAAYEWVGTQGTNTVWNYKEGINKILGRKGDMAVNRMAMDLVSTLGHSSAMLEEIMGKDAFRLLEIEAIPELADQDIQNKLEKALGLMSIAVMENMGLLTKKRVYSGIQGGDANTLQATTGLYGLRNMQDTLKLSEFDGVSDHFMVPDSIEDVFTRSDSGELIYNNADEGIVSFYRVAVQPDKRTNREQISQDIYDRYVAPYKASPHTWSMMFTGEQSRTAISWSKIPHKEEPARLKKTEYSATEEQTKMRDQHQDKPRAASQRTMGIAHLLGSENLGLIQGKIDVASRHIENRKGAEGINRSIDNGNQIWSDWLDTANQQDNGYKTPFYVTEDFWRQGRMGEATDVNMQGNKSHRAFWNFAAWEVEFELNDLGMTQAFKEAIAFNLDKEQTKEGGIDGAIAAAEELLKAPKVEAAVEAIKKVIGDKDLDIENLENILGYVEKDFAEEAAIITEGVLEVDNGMAGMKALLEYARYQVALQDKSITKFNTDITTELDGVANGIAMGRIQLISNKANGLGVLTTLQNSGFVFARRHFGLAKKLTGNLTFDAYKSVGFQWSNELLAIENTLIKSKSISDQQTLIAFNNIFGEFRDSKGQLSSAVRSLSKAPTMTTLFGMQEAALLANLSDALIDSMYGLIEKAVAADDLSALNRINRDVYNITEKNLFAKKPSAMGKDEILTTKLTPVMERSIKEGIKTYHGKALSKAINTIYGDMQDAYKPLNAGLNLATSMYNTVRTLKIRQRQKEIGPDKKMTVKDVQDIDESIKDMFPTMVTPFGGKIPLAKRSKDKTYALEEKVSQSYLKGSGKTTTPYQTGGLEHPGVGGTILGLHNLDSYQAINLMGLFDILNTHDGFTAAIGMGIKVGQSVNETFQKTMRDFHLGEALHESVTTIQEQYNKEIATLKKEGITEADIDAISVKEFTAGRLADNTIGKDKDITIGNVEEVLDKTMEMMEAMAIETKTNKKTVMDAVIGMEQYSYEGGHYDTTKSRIKEFILNGTKINLTAIKSTSEEKIKKENKENASLHTAILLDRKKSGLFSGPKGEKLSQDPEDYALQQQVSSMNILDIYQNIKNTGLTPVDSEHDIHLQHLLKNVIQNVVNPLDLFTKNNPFNETEGVFVPETGQVFMSTQTKADKQFVGPIHKGLYHGIRMSAGEVYVHELLHPVLYTGLEENARLYNKVTELFKIARNKLEADANGFRFFLNDPDIDLTDPAYTYDIAAAKERYNNIFNNTGVTRKERFAGDIDPSTNMVRIQERSNYLHEFMIFALSNKNLKKYVTGIDLTGTQYAKGSWKDIQGKNIQETLGNIFQKIMDFFYRKISSSTTAGNMSQELETLAVLLTKHDSTQKSAILKTTQAVEDRGTAVSEYANEYIKKALKSWPIVKGIHQMQQGIEYIKLSDSIVGQRMREMELAYRRLDQGIIKSIATEVQGRTDRLDWLHILISKRKLFLDTAKENETEKYIKGVNQPFKKALDDKQKAAITQGMIMSDASILYDSLTPAGLLKVMESPQEVDKQIKAINTLIAADSELASWEGYYNLASDAMGHNMIHGQGRSDEIPFENARVIAETLNIPNRAPVSKAAADRAEPLIDQLGSLYALKYVPSSNLKQVAELLKTEPDGMRVVIRMHQVLKDKALEDSFGGNKYKFTKGYTKSILNSQIGIMYGTASDEKELAKGGYMKRGLVERDKLDPTVNEKVYIYISRTKKINDFLSVGMSATNNRAAGVNSVRLAHQLGLTSLEGRQNNATIVKRKNKILEKMATPGFKPKLKKGSHMIPLVNEKGYITQYRYMMSESTKTTYMEQITAFDTILGSMAGQIVDKVRSPQINRDFIDGLKAMYDEEYAENPNAYVKIGPNSTEEKLREIYYMIPDKARSYMKTVWKGDSMYVAKDVVDMAFGYRQYSIVDAFTKNPAEQHKLEKIIVKLSTMCFQDKAVHRLNTLENIAIEATKLAKSSIIVKSLHVTVNNLGSNMVYLKSRGVPVSQIIKQGWEAVVMGNKYQSDAKELRQLELDIDIAKKNKVSPVKIKKIQGAIVRMTDTLRKNPVSLAIEAGMMPTLLDDIETVTGGESFPTEIEKKITKVTSKLPEVVQNVGKTLAMTEDTKAFQALNNAVRMTDFIGRYVLYNHYTATEGMSHKDAVAAVTDEFVNFNIPTHRMIEWLNSVGIFWFTKYGLRILKTIKNAAVDKPFTFFSTLMMSNGLGMDNIANSTPGFKNISDPATGLMNALPESLFTNMISQAT